MQSVSSRIWTRVAVSISYDDNHCTMGTSGNYLYKRDKLFLKIKESAGLFVRLYSCNTTGEMIKNGNLI